MKASSLIRNDTSIPDSIRSELEMCASMLATTDFHVEHPKDWIQVYGTLHTHDILSEYRSHVIKAAVEAHTLGPVSGINDDVSLKLMKTTNTGNVVEIKPPKKTRLALWKTVLF